MEQKDPEAGGKPRDKEHSAEQKKADLKVEIRQYQTLLDILNKPKSTLKVIFAMMVFALALFLALAFTTIAIKRFYPYNEIKTNAFGATTMQNEEVELTYWLFNTAHLWADSGIKVKRGDVLTIRASGQSNTSIHHLVDHAFYNARPRYEWVGTEGQPRSANTRTAYRIYPDRDPDALILQVIPEENSSKERYLRPDYLSDSTVKDQQERFYYIGKERTNLIIKQEGTLRFAVNDIVLTRPCIDSMQWKNDLVFRKLYGDREYVRLLSLRYDTATLSKMRENHLIPCAPDIKDTVLHKKVRTILDLRKKCDLLKEFYRYLNDHIGTGYDPTDTTRQKLALYLGNKKHLDSLLQERSGKGRTPSCSNIESLIRGKSGKELCRLLFENDSLRKDFTLYCDSTHKKHQGTIDTLLEDTMLNRLCSLWRNANDVGLYFGPHPVPLRSEIDEGMERISPLRNKSSEIRDQVFPFYNEMTYYRDENYYNAWFDDNIGTFLIVVERRKN